MQGEAAPALGDHLEIARDRLAQARLRTLSFFLFRGHAHQRQRLFVPRAKTVQRVKHPERVPAVGLHPPAMLVPHPRAHDVIGDSSRRELPMQREAQRPRFITRHDAKTARELLVDPAQKVRGLETLWRFGMRAFLLDGRDVERQMDVQCDLEQRLNLSLSCRSNAGRNGVVIHMGRQCGTRVRPVSALMFSNKARVCVKRV